MSLPKLSSYDRYIITKYYPLDEVIEQVRPDLIDPVRNPALTYHLKQLKLHREAAEAWVNDSDNWEEEDDY